MLPLLSWRAYAAAQFISGGTMSRSWDRREFLLGGQALAIATALDRAYAGVLPQEVTQDDPRMITTWEQRARRDHIVLRQLAYKVPVASPSDLVAMFERAIGPKTRVIHFSQVVFMTGQIFPVKELCTLARQRGIISIV